MASIDWSSKIAEYLNVGADTLGSRGALLAAIGSSVQHAIETRIGRHLDVQSHTEVYDGNGHRVLFLRWDPVVSVTALTVNGATIVVPAPDTNAYPPSQIVIRDRNSLAYTDGGFFSLGYGNVVVTYSAGYAVPPDSIVQAGVLWGAAIFRDRDRVGMSSSGAAGQTTSFTRDLPKHVEQAIAAYVRWDKPC